MNQREQITITIDESGDLTFLETAMAEGFKTLGSVEEKRASHVEPYDFWPRLAFRIIRWLVADDSKWAERTRWWLCDWRVNTKPVGGPILRWRHVYEPTVPYPNVVYRFKNRKDAIAAEIEFLNKFFLGAK